MSVYKLPFNLFLLLVSSLVFAQDDSSNSESAAEASVSGSASKKALGPPDSTESSPLIVVAKAGLSLDLIVNTSQDSLRAITSLGNAAALKSAVASVNSGNSDFNRVVSMAVEAQSTGTVIQLSEIQQRTEVIQTYVKSGLTGAELTAKVNSLKNLSTTFNADAEKRSANAVTSGGDSATALQKLQFQSKLEASGISSTYIPSLLNAYSTTAIAISDDTELDTFVSRIASAFTGNYALINLTGNRGQLDSTSDETSLDEPISVEKIVKFHPDVLKEFTNVVDSDARYGLFDLFYNVEALSSSELITEVNPEIIAFADLANTLFTDRTLGGSNTLADLQVVDLNYIVTKSPAQRLLNYLSQYNILGFNNDGQGNNNLVSALPTDLFSRDYSNSDVTDFAEYLATYSTTRDSSGNLVTQGRGLGDNDLSAYKIPLSNIKLYPGKNITIGGTLDVSSELPEATLSNGYVTPDDIRIAIIGAANDVTISEDLTINNNNQVEDHALVIAATDDLVVSSGKKIDYEGSNFALASGDTMYLVDVDIEAGGNIAIGTLNDLHITSGSSITAGIGGNTPNDDLVLLYANDLLNLHNVDFGSNIREIHLDAQRVQMKNIVLPLNSFLKINTPGSRKWQNAFVTVEGSELKFTGSATSSGTVVLENVTHPNIGVLNASNLPEVTGI